MKPSRLAVALKAWRELEKQCAESAKRGSAFLVDDKGQLRLYEGRPVLNFIFARAWTARREVERVAAAEGKAPPPVETSALYVEWPSLNDAMTQFFLVAMRAMEWSEVDASFLAHFDQAEPTTITPITE